MFLPANLKILKAVAHDLQAGIFKPYYPVSDRYRMANDDQGLQLDFMSRLHGVRSFEGLRSRAARVEFGQRSLTIASLRDIVASKRAACRTRDLAVIAILEKTLDEQESINEKSGSGNPTRPTGRFETGK